MGLPSSPLLLENLVNYAQSSPGPRLGAGWREWCNEVMAALNWPHCGKDELREPRHLADQHREFELPAANSERGSACEASHAEMLAQAPGYAGDSGRARPYSEPLAAWPESTKAVSTADVVAEADSAALQGWGQSMLNPESVAAELRESPGASRPYADPELRHRPKSCAQFLKQPEARDAMSRQAASPLASFTTSLFFVEKSNHMLRFAFDTRMANCSFAAPPAARHPTPGARASVDCDDSIVFAQGDIQCAFYHLRLPAGKESLFSLPAISNISIGLKSINGAPTGINDFAQPLVTVAPMGWRVAGAALACGFRALVRRVPAERNVSDRSCRARAQKLPSWNPWAARVFGGNAEQDVVLALFFAHLFLDGYASATGRMATAALRRWLGAGRGPGPFGPPGPGRIAEASLWSFSPDQVRQAFESSLVPLQLDGERASLRHGALDAVARASANGLPFEVASAGTDMIVAAASQLPGAARYIGQFLINEFFSAVAAREDLRAAPSLCFASGRLELVAALRRMPSLAAATAGVPRALEGSEDRATCWRQKRTGQGVQIRHLWVDKGNVRTSSDASARALRAGPGSRALLPRGIVGVVVALVTQAITLLHERLGATGVIEAGRLAQRGVCPARVFVKVKARRQHPKSCKGIGILILGGVLREVATKLYRGDSATHRAVAISARQPPTQRSTLPVAASAESAIAGAAPEARACTRPALEGETSAAGADSAACLAGGAELTPIADLAPPPPPPQAVPQAVAVSAASDEAGQPDGSFGSAWPANPTLLETRHGRLEEDRAGEGLGRGPRQGRRLRARRGPSPRRGTRSPAYHFS
ncbi:unnamed protein product [Prorocentrum cordatum]|uniref:Uncharacterized protein n=1 Tax=Prorocentrum cordatum TaxID=2364126 RepID=A0ABN9VSG8_9DINO|nr:unnamed protein product [Polarella glacialis]